MNVAIGIDAPARGRLNMLSRAAKGLRYGQLWLAILALALMMLVTVADVGMRYLFNRPISGAYDFTESMLVVFVFHSMAHCFWSRSHIVIDLIDFAVGARTRAALIRLSDVAALAMLALLAAAMVKPALQAYGFGDRKLELDLPLYILWIAALAGMAGTLLSAVFAVFAPLPADAVVGEQPS